MAKLTFSAAALVMSLALLVQSAAAATCSGNMKGLRQEDFDAIKNCKIYNGTITVESTPASELSLDGVERIDGHLLIQGNADLRSFSAPQLNKVKGDLKFINHVLLEKINLPGLAEVGGLSLAVLPALQTIQFPTGLIKANNVLIEDTRAHTVSGFRPESLNTFQLTNNNYLKQFDFSSVKEMKGSLVVTANGQNLDFEAANLASVQNATFRNIGQLNLQGLTRVASDISFHQNQLVSLNLDNIDVIGGTLTIANNDKLAETSFKNLSKVGGALSVGNNTELKMIDGFPNLGEVDGTVDLAGNFDGYKLPVLQDVRGGMRLQTTSSQFQCSDLEKKLKGDNVVKGNTWSCASSLQQNEMSPTVGQRSGLDGNGNSLSSNGHSALAGARSALICGSWLALALGPILTFGM